MLKAGFLITRLIFFPISQFASQSQVRAYVHWRKSVLKWRQSDVEIDMWRRYDVDIQISFTHLVPSCMHDSNSYNYNCHNIYRDPLIWLVKNGHLVILTCFSFFNELLFVFMRGGDIHDGTFFVILCNASMKRNGQSATTDTFLYTYTDIFRWKNEK